MRGGGKTALGQRVCPGKRTGTPAALNRFLIRYAFQNQQAEASQTYVALAGDEVVGFYTLVVAQVEYDDAPQRLGKGLARHPIPLMLLAGLAVATSWQGKGLGSGLLLTQFAVVSLELKE